MSGFAVEHCRTCNMPIIWAVTNRLRDMPVDAESSPDGNIRLEPREGMQPMARVLPVAEQFGKKSLHKSHFATCPQAGRWRRGWVPPPALPEAEVEAFRLPPERPGDAELAADVPEPPTEPAPVLVPEPVVPTPVVPKPRRPRRSGVPSYAAPGEVLLSYPAWSCVKCSGRRFEAFSCCSAAAIPVTVTLTRREVSDG